jgi:2-dehydropantoate 2-reductase
VFAYGPRSDSQCELCAALLPELQRGGFGPQLSSDIMQDMWEKFVMLTTLAGMTCLMRASMGEIMATKDGHELTLGMLGECCAVASANGHPPRPRNLEITRATLTERGSAVSASMRRDLESGGRIEADHIVGDMFHRAEALGQPAPLLRTAYCHLQCYQNRLA